jgi:hypothetical protein
MEIESISGIIVKNFNNCKLLKVQSQITNLAQRKEMVFSTNQLFI